MQRSILLLFACAWLMQINAQEHPFLAEFKLSEAEDAVKIEWTMIAGGTCVGTTIMRSLDSLSFQPVGYIDGICGNITEPINYDLVDHTAPELSKLYYRLELGSNGSSSIKAIELQRLRSVLHRFQPLPVSDQGELLLDVDPETPVVIVIFDGLGKMMNRMEGRGGRHFIDVDTWDRGLYIYQVAINGERANGKFVVE